MPSTYTQSLRLEQQGIGENQNTWGNKLNATIAAMDQAVAGHTSVQVSAGTTVLSAVNNATDQSRNHILEFKGSLTGAVTIEVPEVSKSYIVWDSTTRSGNSITLRLGGSGATVEIPPMPAGRSVSVSTDGSKWVTSHITQASTSQAGLVELATGAETRTGTEPLKAVTPEGLATLTASATRSGLVELATNAETIAGTDSSRAVTPGGLASLTATDSRRGLAEFATPAETRTGTASSLAVTPEGLASLTSTTSRRGLVELATQTEVNGGSDSSRAVVPSTLESRLNTRLGTSGNLGTAATKNEGSGNGLDADKLDGLHGAAYLKKTEFDPETVELVWSGEKCPVSFTEIPGMTPGFYLMQSTSFKSVLVYTAMNSTTGASALVPGVQGPRLHGYTTVGQFYLTDETFSQIDIIKIFKV